MAHMIDSIAVTRADIYKGAARLVYKPLGMSFPDHFEDIMTPTTPETGTAYALASGWVDIGATTDDGVVVTREAEVGDGIVVDQRLTALDEGEPEKWNMSAEATLVATTLENIRLAWEAGTIVTEARNVGVTKAQHVLTLDAPAAFTKRIVAFIQEDPGTGALRALAFRSGKPQVDGNELALKRTEASNIPLKLKLEQDQTVGEGYGQFGKILDIDD